MAFQKITESESLYDNLDQMSVRELLEGINNEDRKVAIAVGREIPKIEKLVTRIVERCGEAVGSSISGRVRVVAWASWTPPRSLPRMVCRIPW